MICGILFLQAASAGVLTCQIHILPHAMLLAPPDSKIYDQAQRDAIQAGRDRVPALASLSGLPSLVQMAGAIPEVIPTGATLPLLDVLTAQSADTWTADDDYIFTGADIVPYCNPDVVTPSIGAAWAASATITYQTAASRGGIFNPNDYDPFIYITNSRQLYFPKPENFIRSSFVIFQDYPQASGIYWYRYHAIVTPAFMFLYTTPGSSFFTQPDYQPHPFLTVQMSPQGFLQMSDYAFLATSPYGEPNVRYDAYGSKWNGIIETQGFRKVPSGPTGYGYVTANAPGLWSAPDVPAKVRPGQRRKAAGIVAPVTALLLLGSLLTVGAASPTPGRRRRKY